MSAPILQQNVRRIIRHESVGLAIMLLVAIAACHRSPSEMGDRLQAGAVIGTWQSEHRQRSDDNTADVFEREQWQLGIDPQDDERLLGDSWRIIDVTSRDGLPFHCSGRSSYQLVAHYQLRGERTALPQVLKEQLVSTVASPCEHGFRQTTTYTVDIVNHNQLSVVFADGSQQMQRLLMPWTEPSLPSLDLRGRWTSTVVSLDESSRKRTELERWQISAAPASTAVAAGTGAASIGVTYQRWITVAALPLEIIGCANASRFVYQEQIVAEGNQLRNADGTLLYTIRELAMSRSAHPCVDPTANAIAQPLNEATLELRGDYLVVEWRGKRRQVLHRE